MIDQETLDNAKRRLAQLEGKYTSNFPRWTLRDYALFSKLVSDVETMISSKVGPVPGLEGETL